MTPAAASISWTVWLTSEIGASSSRCAGVVPVMALNRCRPGPRRWHENPLAGYMAPSTVGTLLRELTFGHVHQLDSVLTPPASGWAVLASEPAPRRKRTCLRRRLIFGVCECVRTGLFEGHCATLSPGRFETC